MIHLSDHPDHLKNLKNPVQIKKDIFLPLVLVFDEDTAIINGSI